VRELLAGILMTGPIASRGGLVALMQVMTTLTTASRMPWQWFLSCVHVCSVTLSARLWQLWAAQPVCTKRKATSES
jgi:hypothetical protein